MGKPLEDVLDVVVTVDETWQKRAAEETAIAEEGPTYGSGEF